MKRTEQEQNMPCNIKFDVRYHFMFGFYSNASINKLNTRPLAFWQEKDEFLAFSFSTIDTKDICHTTAQ